MLSSQDTEWQNGSENKTPRIPGASGCRAPSAWAEVLLLPMLHEVSSCMDGPSRCEEHETSIGSSNCALGDLPQGNENLVAGSLQWGAQCASEVRRQRRFLKELLLLPGSLWQGRVNPLSRPLGAQPLPLSRDHRTPAPPPLDLQKYCSITPQSRQKRNGVGKARWLSPVSNLNHYYL